MGEVEDIVLKGKEGETVRERLGREREREREAEEKKEGDRKRGKKEREGREKDIGG